MFSAAVLAALEEDLGLHVIDHFDLIVGTSTGGIIALCLGAGMSPREIVEFYAKEGPKIFRKPWIPKKQLLRVKYDNSPLKSALKTCLGQKRMIDSQKRLVIPSYSLDADDVYIFKTPHHKRFRRDFKVPMWQVGMATSAAPTYLPAYDEIDHIRLIDGGVWANNPVMVGIVEAVSILNIPLDSIAAFSLGTTCEVPLRGKGLTRGGYVQWRNAGVKTVMRGQSVGATTQATHIIGEDRVLRCDPKVPESLFALDKVSSDELMGTASHHSRIIAPEFEKLFRSHKAREFEPALDPGGIS